MPENPQEGQWMSLDQILAERDRKYENFYGHAETTWQIKTVIAEALKKRGKQLDPDMLEALDMIAHKIGRIINGDAWYIDSWIDLSGYPKLVADRLQAEQRVATVNYPSTKKE